LIKQKYDIPKEILELMKSQEEELKNINNQLTNQKKVFEKIHNNTNDIYNYIDKIDTLQKFTLFLGFLTYLNVKYLQFL
jgi:regulator of sigma D